MSKENEKKNKVVIYVRVSSQRQEYERQLKELKNYCGKNRLSVEKVFKEKVSGAKSRAERPAFNECLNYIQNNQINKLVVWEFSRLGRDSIDIQLSISELHDLCCSVFIYTMNLDTLNDKCQETIQGKLVVGIFSQIAEIERDNIQRRLKSGYDNYRKNGGAVGRKVGYKKPIEATKNYKKIVNLLQIGNKIKDIALMSEVSMNTVRKVREHLRKQEKL
jgi:DNA invertase Pin-like site-specific DNA recombinase